MFGEPEAPATTPKRRDGAEIEPPAFRVVGAVVGAPVRTV